MPAIATKRNDKAAAKKVGGKKKKVDSEDEAYVAAKGAKDKKEKDPNAPKKPQTSYFLFMNAKREGVKTAEPGLKFGELTQKLTQMWKNLSETERKEFDDLAQKDRDRYQTEMEAAGLAKKKVLHDASAPKKPQSSFFLFSHEARERMKKDDPDVKQTELLKKIGAEWKSLSEGERKKWDQKSKADKERYETEMAAYKGADPAAGDKRPANKGPAAGSKKAKKETQSDDNEEEAADEDEDEAEDEEEEDTKE